MDEDLLDEIGEAMPSLPEPLAAAAATIEVSRVDGDATGVRKHCFELGIDVVRYATSLALALIAESLKEQRPPKPIAKALSKAGRMTDGEWCGLLRSLAKQIEALDGPAELFGFAGSKALADLVAARNRFVHEGARGDDAPEHVLALLEAAASLLALPLCHVQSTDPPTVQKRTGLPLRAGAWRKHRGDAPAELDVGGHAILADRWLRVTPWLPVMDERMLLPEAPHASGKSWRMLDPETGERRSASDLDEAVRKLVGDDASLPIVPNERPAVVGRDEVLTTLRRTAELATEGGVYLVLLTGPQGIGRGRMLELVRESGAAYGFGTVVEASCSPTRRSPLRPLRRALANVPELSEVVELVARACEGDAIAGRAGLEAAVEAVEEALVERSAGHPILLTLDDLQWADDLTLLLLSLLVERATRKADGHMFVVVGLRDEPNPSVELTRLLGEVERDVGPGATRLGLLPLAPDASRQLVKNIAPLDGVLEDTLVDGAGGVPFFMVQSLLAWFETGALTWERAAWRPTRDEVVQQPVPGMADVVRARLVSFFEPGSRAERLAQQLLLGLGLAGGSLGQTPLRGITARIGAEPQDAEHVLEVLVDSGMLAFRREGREHAFAQGVVRHAVVQALRDKPWAERVHRALLEEVAAAGQDEDAPFLAAGYQELGDRTAAAHWLDLAIAYGLRVGLFVQAADWAERLAELCDDDADRNSARVAGARALLRAGRAVDAAARLREVQHATGESAVRARIVATAVADATAAKHDDPSLVADAERCGRRLGIEARLALARQTRGASGESLTEQAIDLLEADDPSDLRYRAMVLRFELYVETRSLDDPECRNAALHARHAAEATGSTWAMLDARNDEALLEMAAGRHDDAHRMLQEVAKEAATRHFGSMQRGALVNMATNMLRAGKLQSAASIAERAAEQARSSGDIRSVAMAASVRADALRRQGQLDEAKVAIDEAIAIGLDSGETNLPVRLFRRADICAELGDHGSVRADLQLALAQAESTGSAQYIARARLRLALLAVEQGEAGARQELERVVASYADSQAGAVKELVDRGRELLARQ